MSTQMYLLCVELLGTIPILGQQRVVSEKWKFLQAFGIIYADTGCVGGSEKVQKCADVI